MMLWAPEERELQHREERIPFRHMQSTTTTLRTSLEQDVQASSSFSSFVFTSNFVFVCFVSLLSAYFFALSVFALSDFISLDFTMWDFGCPCIPEAGNRKGCSEDLWRPLHHFIEQISPLDRGGEVEDLGRHPGSKTEPPPGVVVGWLVGWCGSLASRLFCIWTKVSTRLGLVRRIPTSS